MGIKISEDILKFTELSEQEINLEIVIMLYKKQKLSLGQASELTKMHQHLFQKELAKRNIPLNYDINALKEDLYNLGYFKKL